MQFEKLILGEVEFRICCVMRLDTGNYPWNVINPFFAIKSDEVSHAFW